MDKKVTKLFLLLFALLAPAVGWAQDATLTVKGMTFTWDTNYYVLTSFDAAAYANATGNESGATFNLQIPETIGELTGNGEPYDIGGIGQGVFSDVTTLSSIELPAILSRIEANAFSGCTNLQNVLFKGPITNIDIDDTAFSGTGTVDPVSIDFDWTYEEQFQTAVTSVAQWSDGIGDWKGGKIRTYNSTADFLQGGYRILYALNGYRDGGEDLTWKVISANKVTDPQDLPDNFNGQYVLSIDEEIVVANIWKSAQVTAVKDGVFTGIGTATEPVIYDGKVSALKRWGMTFSNGVGQLAGGYFQVVKSQDDMGIRATYAYSEDAEGNGEYIGIKTEKSPYDWWGEDFTDYQLVINGSIYGDWDIVTQESTEYPVKNYKAGFAEGVKDLVKGVQFFINKNVPAFEDGALAGIGTTAAPMILETDAKNLKKMGATFSNGITQLGGGYFQVFKYQEDYGILVTYAYNEDADGNSEYIATKAEKSENVDPDYSDYQLVIYGSIYDGWDSETQTSIYNPVKTYKAGFAEGVKDLVKAVQFYIKNNVPAFEDGALAGLGTAEAPMNLDASVKEFKDLGGTFSNGVALLAGGNFLVTRNYYDYGILVTYAYNEDAAGKGEYIATKAEKDGDNYSNYQLFIYGMLDEWDDATQTSVYYPVKTVKAGFADGVKDLVTKVWFYRMDENVPSFENGALAGIGTAEAPMNMDVTVSAFKNMGGTFSNGVALLAGGYFQKAQDYTDYGIRVTYVYNEDADGNGGYIVTKAEKYRDNYSDYQIAIYGSFNEWDSETEKWVDIPVSTVKAGFADGVKSLITGIYFKCNETVPTFEEGALAGLGTAAAPMMASASSPYGLVKNLNAEAQDGVYSIGGGFFQFRRQSGYIYYALNGEEYIAVGYDKDDIQHDINNGYEVSVSFPQSFREYWYENGTSKSKALYVTGVKEGAFEGLGTAASPMECSTNPVIFQGLGGDISTGVLASGYFKMVRTEWAGSEFGDAKYELVDGAYVLQKPIMPYGGVTSSDLQLYTQFSDWDSKAQKYIITPVSTFKKSAFEEMRNVTITQLYMEGTNATAVEAGAFEGFGATEPLVLTLNGKTFKEMGGVFAEDGVATLASGKFIIGQAETINGINVIYAYGEDAAGNILYNVYKTEKKDYGNDYPYALFIRDYFYERDAANQRDIYYYVKGISANAIGDDVKNVIKYVQLESNRLNSIDATVFSGIGTAAAPMEIRGNIATISKLATISNDGLVALGGGNFKYTYAMSNNGITVIHQLTSPITDNVAELTVVGYEQNEGYDSPTVNILGATSYYWTSDSNDDIYVTLRTTKIAPNAFKDIQGVTAVSIDGTYLQEIGTDAFAGIGAQGANVPLTMSIVLINRFKDQMQGSQLKGGYFDIARIDQSGGLEYTYLFADGGYELTKVKKLYNYSTYTASIRSGFSDYSQMPVEYTDIDGNTVTGYYPAAYVKKVKAGIFADVADKITSVKINDGFGNTKIEFEDGSLTGIGSAEEGASFLAKPAQIQAIIGDRVSGDIYNIKGGFFALKAITIKAQKNNDGFGYAITYATGRDENDNYAQLINWNTEMSPELMRAPAEGDNYYTYTFLGASAITDLSIYTANEYEQDGQKRRYYNKQVYYNRETLAIDRDTTFIWNDKKGRLLLEGAPMEYDIYVAGQIVTDANAGDILANDPGNAGKAKYDAETNTLTLDGINISDYSGYNAIRNDVEDGLTIVVNGDNTISGGWPMSYFGAKTTIEGDGTLNFNYLNGSGDSDCRIDIQADVTIKDITLNSTGAYYGFRGKGKLTVENAIINVEEVASQYGYAMTLDGLVLNGAAILAPEGAVFTDGDNGKGVYDAEGNIAKRLYIGEPAAFTVAIDVLNLDADKTEKATLTVENSGAVSGIALPADMAGANFSIVLPDKVVNPDKVEVAITSVGANAFAGKNLKQIQLPLNNGFVHIGTGAVNSTTKILAPVGYLKNYKELASIADNVTGELLAGYVVTDKNLVTIGVEVNVRTDANAKYYIVGYGDDNETAVGELYEEDVIPEMSGLIVETTDDVKGIELIVTVDNADKTRFDNSMLFPVFADTDLSNDEGNYILVGDEFKRASSLSNAVAKAGTAYLYDPAGSVAVITLTLNGSEDTPDTPTSINERSLDDEDGEWYSINGQRINKPTRKGIYIKNGKKVTVK